MPNTPLRTELPYVDDAAPIFEALRGAPWAVLLESSERDGERGRYDILAADPFATLVTRQGESTVERGGERTRSTDSPFTLLRRLLGDPAPPLCDLPFAGGAVGYVGYDLLAPGGARDDLPTDPPDLAFGLYDWAVILDHGARRAWLASHGREPATRRRWRELVERFSSLPAPRPANPFRALQPPVASLDPAAYRQAFTHLQRYIRDGECYQANLAIRFDAPVEGDGWEAYRRLRRLSPVPFGAFLDLPGVQILSASPERFLTVREGRVESRPIKGTRPRGTSLEEDERLREELLASPKDRAENLMIVDLLRNDLGKSCRYGSVRVPELFRVERFARVHHLVSSITGELADGRDAIDLLEGCLPGGSITGAPKRRAMEIIAELEPHPRSIYCGAIGYLGFDGSMDTNIAIRTLIHSGGRARFWAGGGIVADSKLEEEYRECYVKAAPMLELLQDPRGERRFIQA